MSSQTDQSTQSQKCDPKPLERRENYTLIQKIKDAYEDKIAEMILICYTSSLTDKNDKAIERLVYGVTLLTRNVNESCEALGVKVEL